MKPIYLDSETRYYKNAKGLFIVQERTPGVCTWHSIQRPDKVEHRYMSKPDMDWGDVNSIRIWYNMTFLERL